MTDLKLLWEQAFNDSITEEQNKSGVNSSEWRTTKTRTKKEGDREDGAWWDASGFEMFANFTEVWKNSGLKVWTTPDDRLSLELNLNVNYGDILVKAFIDCVAVTPDGQLAVIDWKTGKSMPDSMQLGLYATSIERTFGIRPSLGFYYDARAAIMVPTENLDRWTYPLFTEYFRQFDLAVENEIFLPSPGWGCSTCGVKDYCHVQGGEMASLFDPLYAIANKKDG